MSGLFLFALEHQNTFNLEQHPYESLSIATDNRLLCKFCFRVRTTTWDGEGGGGVAGGMMMFYKTSVVFDLASSK